MAESEIWREFRELRRQIKDRVEEAVGAVVRWSRVTASSADGQSDAVEGWGHPDEGTSQIRARRVMPFGLWSRQPTKITAAIVRVFGKAAQSLLLGTGGERYAPQDLEEGETALYCIVDGALFKLTLVGKVEITSADDQNITIDAGGTGDVKVNGGTAKVGRVGDACRITAELDGGALALWMKQVEAGISGAGGTPPTPLAATFVAAPGITINAGADRFKA